ncbi:hypothetical protein K470DRAFT_271320 [Piedraia hortae CBS 480.64]|uniref:Uncharacterized protein n=1 Tax=Piedraia hortae CBS 480.64 TaxID=1314780 RepID=A0A6A7BYG4_9PEZI|nr:hypothetical protein K470DRAFT_271320 [Piedraia hortae CBS 480.64]
MAGFLQSLIPATSANRAALSYPGGNMLSVQYSSTFSENGFNAANAHSFANYPAATPQSCDSSSVKRTRGLNADYDMQATASVDSTEISKLEPSDIITRLLQHPDLGPMFIKHVHPSSVASLTVVCRSTYGAYKNNQLSLVRSLITRWVPYADMIFPWNHYIHLCDQDEYDQTSHIPFADGIPTARYIPGLKWLQMVVYRRAICQGMIIQLALHGHRCPRGTLESLQRLWFLMDLPLNVQRVAVVTSSYFDEYAIFCAMLFIVKVDLYLSSRKWTGVKKVLGVHTAATVAHCFVGDQAASQLAGSLECRGWVLRQVLLSRKTMTPLWCVLHGWAPDRPHHRITCMDVIQLLARHHDARFLADAPSLPDVPVMGMLPNEFGTANLERSRVVFVRRFDGTRQAFTHVNPAESNLFWTIRRMEQMLPGQNLAPKVDIKNVKVLVGVDSLIIMESCHRHMHPGKMLNDMGDWGRLDSHMRNITIPSREELESTDGMLEDDGRAERKLAEHMEHTHKHLAKMFPFLYLK